MKRSLLKWELTGIAVVFLLGSAFHFLFDLLGGQPFLGVFFAVNESVFEHLKLTFWPAVLWAAFSYRFIRQYANNFLTAKAASFIIMPVVIVILFYGYTELTGWENLFVDIFIFLVAVAAGQLTGYAIMAFRPLPSWVTVISILAIICVGTLYAVFTYYPPHTEFFMDTAASTYGLPH